MPFPTSIAEATVLHNGVRMPWLGLGVWKTQNGQETVDAVTAAIRNGYRAIDTAAIYKNEESVGRAIAESGVNRNELFITTKVWNDDQGYDSTLRAFDKSRELLGLDVIDLYLVHWPGKDKFKETYRALETLYNDGKVRAIGVSNFKVHHLEELMGSCNIKPMVNQVEFHPLLTQKELLNFCRKHSIQLEAWSPLMQGNLDIPLLKELGDKYGKTPAQIVLRWDLQHGVVTIPKSVHEHRIKENADVFDFQLSDAEMEAIDGLNQDKRFGSDPDEFLF
jgi:Aldo/keto reductases, related to diketogulonate reductase